VCSGALDKAVPYDQGKAFMDFFTDATKGWYKQGGVQVEDKVYEGAAHEFSQEMVEDAVKFITSNLEEAERGRALAGSKM
ncbi:MAG: alpha/beta hydrolase, partial [Thaumarchaeota archaeon]|nr:alpha/beta hydrolase [Nitrososphaerota archaeon]